MHGSGEVETHSELADKTGLPKLRPLQSGIQRQIESKTGIEELEKLEELGLYLFPINLLEKPSVSVKDGSNIPGVTGLFHCGSSDGIAISKRVILIIIVII